MADPAAPTVPNANGVPPVNGGNTAPAAPLATSDSTEITVVGPPKSGWGIRNTTSGQPIWATGQGPDSYKDQDDSKEFNVPDYNEETGAFQSYNKIEKAGEVKISVLKSGTSSELNTFRQALDALQASTDLCTIFTPGRTFRNYNLLQISVSRSAAAGATLITYGLTFAEIMSSVTETFSSVAAASDANTTSGGSVQATPPSAQQTPGVPPT